MNRGAHVVAKARLRQLSGARAAADRVLRLQDQHGASGARDRERSGQAVRPGANDYGV
jgi:hypothetical protein